jgi:hypothetical protein
VAKEKKRKAPGLPDGEVAQHKHLDKTGRGTLARNMDRQGKMATRAEEKLQTLPQDSEQRAVLEEISPYLKDRAVNYTTAANRRINHFENGSRRAYGEGLGLEGSGAGWYFRHRLDLENIARGRGFDMEDVIVGSSMMSPLNSPDNEKAAVRGLMNKVRGLPQEYETDLGKTGPGQNGPNAEQRLRTGEGQNDPHNKPKVKSYEMAIRDAAPTIHRNDDGSEDFYRLADGADAMVEQEYMERARLLNGMVNGTIAPGQMSFDFTGLRDSREGILDPRRTTAEDSWMHAITLGQELAPNDRGVSVGKTVASEKIGTDVPNAPWDQEHGGRENNVATAGNDANGKPISPSHRAHIFNNESTVRAAGRIGRQYGLTDDDGRSLVPSVLMQEVAWTEARRVAEGDPQYNAHRRKQDKRDNAAAKAAAKQVDDGQLTLPFG